MPWKVVNNNDGGSATIWGGDDFDKFSKLYNGDPDVDNIYINSRWEFKDERLFLRNQADSASAKIRVSAISSDVEYTFPLYTANSEIVLDSAPQTLRNKIIDANENTIIGFGSSTAAATKKTGLIQTPMNALGGTVGTGILAGHIDMGTISNGIAPPPHGTHWLYETGSTGFTNAGITYNATFVRRDFNPRLKVKYKLPVSTEGHQILVGFSSDTDITPVQDPLEGVDSGLLVGYADIHDNYMVIRNSGTNAQTMTPTLENISEVLKSNTAYRIVEVAFQNEGTEGVCTIQNQETVPPYNILTEFTAIYTTNLPAITEPGSGESVYMRPVIQLTNQEDVNHMLELCWVELTSDF